MREIRNQNEATLIPESRTVEGYAVVFNSLSKDLGGFVETISPEAANGVIEISDILCLLNHNTERGILARSNKGTGSLHLEVDSKGLKYRFEAPNTALGDELLEGLKRKDITTSSFAFSVADEKWSKREDGTYLRTILRFKELYDVSPVYRAAYDATSVTADVRGLEELKAEENKELVEYYDTLKERLK